MSRINIQLTGIAAELTLGTYMPKDATIFENWEDFYHFNDLIHASQLLVEHISEIIIKQDDEIVFAGKIPPAHFKPQKSTTPALVNDSLYLRTECAEEAVFQCEFETENFDRKKLFFETQDYNLLFKVGKSFLSKIEYDNNYLNIDWVSAKPVGNICLLCRYENGFLVPVYDAINKTTSTPV